MVRDTTALASRFGITIFLNVLFGIIFLNAGGRDDSDDANFNAHFGAITMVLIDSKVCVEVRVIRIISTTSIQENDTE